MTFFSGLRMKWFFVCNWTFGQTTQEIVTSAKKVVCCCDFKDLLFCKLVKVSVCKLCIFLVFGFLRGEQLAITSIPPGGRRGRNPPRCSSQPRRSRQPGWSRSIRANTSIFLDPVTFFAMKLNTSKYTNTNTNTNMQICTNANTNANKIRIQIETVSKPQWHTRLRHSHYQLECTLHRWFPEILNLDCKYIHFHRWFLEVLGFETWVANTFRVLNANANK